MIFGVVYDNTRISPEAQSRDLSSLRALGLSRREISPILVGGLATAGLPGPTPRISLRCVSRADLPSPSARGPAWKLVAGSLVWLLASPLCAQELTQRVEGRLGLGSLSVRDDLLVPYAFTGPALAFGLGYGL